MEGNVESILEEYEGLPRVREGFNEIYWEVGLLSRAKKGNFYSFKTFPQERSPS